MNETYFKFRFICVFKKLSFQSHPDYYLDILIAISINMASTFNFDLDLNEFEVFL